MRRERHRAEDEAYMRSAERREDKRIAERLGREAASAEKRTDKK